MAEFRRGSEFISSGLLIFIDVSLDKIGSAHIESTMKLLHTQTMGMKLRSIKASMGQFLLPEIEKYGYKLDVPELASGQYQIRAAFGETAELVGHSNIKSFQNTNLEKNGIDIPLDDKKFASAILKNKHGTILGSVSEQIIREGKGLHPRAWEVPKSVNWHTTEVNMLVLDDKESLIGKVDKMKPSVMYGVMPALSIVQIWNTARTIRDFYDQNGGLNDPILSANVASAVADSVALLLEGTKVFQKYTHASEAYKSGVKSWKQHLVTKANYTRLAQLARTANVVAAGLSAMISLALVVENYIERDDAMISHAVMAVGFGMLAIGTGFSISLLAISGIGLILLGAVLLHWVFKENDLMEQWLEFGPFAKEEIEIDYQHGGGRMKRKPYYYVDTDYGELKLDDKKRLLSVIDQGDFEWDGDTLVLTKQDPLDYVDGLDTIKIGKIGGPINIDALANKSQRLASDE